MEPYTLSFGTVTLLRPDLAEIVISEGIEVNLDMVNEYRAFVSKHLADPCGMLVNHKNSYAYTFEAQTALADLGKVKALAVVVYSISARIAIETMMKLPTHAHWDLEIFPNREVALQWLEQQLSV